MNYICVLQAETLYETDAWVKGLDKGWLERKKFVLLHPQGRLLEVSAHLAQILEAELDPYPEKWGFSPSQTTLQRLLDKLWISYAAHRSGEIGIVLVEREDVSTELFRLIMSKKFKNPPYLFKRAKPGEAYVIDCLNHKLLAVG